MVGPGTHQYRLLARSGDIDERRTDDDFVEFQQAAKEVQRYQTIFTQCAVIGFHDRWVLTQGCCRRASQYCHVRAHDHLVERSDNFLNWFARVIVPLVSSSQVFFITHRVIGRVKHLFTGANFAVEHDDIGHALGRTAQRIVIGRSIVDIGLRNRCIKGVIVGRGGLILCIKLNLIGL